MRGDNSSERHAQVGVTGSPPHAWGQRRRRFVTADRLQVHPHMRGDNIIPLFLRFQAHGSPPHAWGQLTSIGTASTAVPVHPHMRGDNSVFAGSNGDTRWFTPTCVGTTARRTLANFTTSGSPPHAWGQRALRNIEAAPYRFTPTCVGTTLLTPV